MSSRTLLCLLLLAAWLPACAAGIESPSATAPIRITSPATNAPGPPIPETSPGVALPASSGKAYYVRPDGGSAEECTGLADAPFPGSGTAQPCAWDHPFRALPPGGPPRLGSGDTLLIASGSYRMGFGAPGAEECDQEAAFDCLMPPIPSGLDPGHPTRILGSGWDAGCGDPPEFWGAERPWFILNLTGSRDVEIACLEITDHSSCVEDHTGGLACERETPPFGDWASYGLYAADSAGAYLHDLNIHGLAGGGVHAGRLRDWRVEDVRIAGNGWVGWDGDLGEGDSANAGRLWFRHWVVEWNGCGETYPGDEPAGCWGQEAGGYGDGVGLAETGGDWVIEDSAFLHNTSDGLDLLYHTLGGHISLRGVHAEGNAGNQVKVTGQTDVVNSLLVGNCAFFENQPFTYWVDHCRALGNSLAVFFTGGEQVTILNTTLYGQGDGLVVGGAREGFRCNGAERLVARNTLFQGDGDYFDPGDITFLFYQEDCADLKMDSDYNLVDNVKDVECGAAGNYTLSGSHDRCADPQLTGPLKGAAFGMAPGRGSPAIDGGSIEICPSTDILGRARPADGDGDGVPGCDIGAYEISS